MDYGQHYTRIFHLAVTEATGTNHFNTRHLKILQIIAVIHIAHAVGFAIPAAHGVCEIYNGLFIWKFHAFRFAVVQAPITAYLFIRCSTSSSGDNLLSVFRLLTTCFFKAVALWSWSRWAPPSGSGITP